MNQDNHTPRRFAGRLLAAMTALCLMAMLAPQRASANELYNSSQYTMSVSSDHITLNILVADLNGRDDWTVADSRVKAYSGYGRTGTSYNLLNVYSWDQDNNEGGTHGITACYDMRGATAILVNASNQRINWDRTSYTITKLGSWKYPQAKIDFYWGPQMAGRTWYIYYEGKADNGNSLTYYLGSVYCAARMGRNSLDAGNFTCERTGADKLKFTMPAVPTNNCSNSTVKNDQMHEAWYNLRFTYTLYDGSTRQQSVKFDCGTSRASHDITIPEGVGNYKSVDLRVEAVDAYKAVENGEYFYKESKTFDRNNLLPSVPVPTGLGTEYHQYDAQTDLSWTAFTSYGGNYNYYQTAEPYVYRVETDANGTPLSGQSWSRRGTLSQIGSKRTMTYSDKQGLQANRYYKYMVVNVPSDWKSSMSSQLSSPDAAALRLLGYCESGVVSTAPTASIYNLQQNTEVTDRVELQWQYSRVPVNSSDISFEVWRALYGTSEWTKIGSVTAKANPDAGSVAKFTDANLENNIVRYDYKVTLSINNGENKFESDAITAGLISGTSVQSISATKGTHESTVRVQWKARQVGTGNTNYDLYRRYVDDSDSDWMKVYSVSGTSDSYTYEDNTVQPGYYYEYRVEAYAGVKDENTTGLSIGTDIGFCQARGVVSGRVTFGSAGTAVDGVRITLRPGSDDSSAPVQGYSQRVDGASTGITWEADSAETAKVFGEGKDFTVQMFVRPDEGLQEGAVIGEIPGEGRLVVGAPQGDGYKLIYAKMGDANITTVTSTQYNRMEACIIDTKAKAEGRSGYYNEDYGTWIYTTEEDVRQKREEIASRLGVRLYDYDGEWIDDIYGSNNYYISTYYKKEMLPTPVVYKTTIIPTYLMDTGLTLPANQYSLVSVQHGETVPIVTVNGQKSDIQLNSFIGSGEIMLEEGNLDSPYMVYNNTLYTVDGVNDKAVKAAYAAAVRLGIYARYNYFPDLAETSQTAEPYLGKFSIGGGQGVTSGQGFKGNFTEVRVWNHALTEKEQADYQDRVLNGRETGLALYWPMDEGLERHVFDASYSFDMPNGRHATVGSNITTSPLVPSEEQLSRYGVTNESGEFAIRGIPFVGSGTTYTFIPTKGIHVFSPASRNGFIGTGSLALNGYDFTDQSSFPLRGKVTYLDTNIPVDSVMFKVDGTLAQNSNGVVYTDNDGNYEISVPIGNHRVEAYREGHRLTTMPLGLGTYDFYRAEVCNFVDSTLVNVTGRINGGFSDKDEPLGFQRSKNRIGQATVKLSLGREAQSSFNYITDDRGNEDFGTTDIPVESATTAIKSTAWRASGTESNNSETHYIYIKTDPETGEFSAMLPPLNYKVEQIRFDGDETGDRARYNNLSFFTQNLPMLNATNTQENKMLADSLTQEGQATQFYRYSAKLIRQLRQEPSISVEQSGMRNGAFGVDTIEVADYADQKELVPVVSYTADGYNYLYDYPLFRQNDTYNMTIKVAEEYYNVDTHETTREVPEDATVCISNEASISTSVVAEEAIVNGEKMEIGQAYDVKTITATPGAEGIVEYSWTAGYPNLSGEHLRSLGINVSVDGRTTVWKAPNKRSTSTALDMVVLGGIITGTNFVTAGPDHVDMILRRPPGSTGYAQFATDSVHTTSTSITTSSAFGGGAGLYASVGPKVKTYQGALAFFAGMEQAIVADSKTVSTRVNDTSESESEGSTYTVSEAMKTPAGDTYTQRDGDTFIGRATNLLFGKGMSVNLFRQDDGTYQIDQQQAICTGETFGTTFVYAHQYIEDELLPNWQLMIDNLLTHVDNPDDDSQAVKVPGKVMYYTRYQKGDAAWGKSNSDINFWTREQIEAAGGMPSYRIVNGLEGEAKTEATDSIEWCQNQISVWKYWLAQNEEDKLEAFDQPELFENNYSIAGGTSVSHSYKNSHTKGNSHTCKLTRQINEELHGGSLWNNLGGYAIGIITKTWVDADANSESTSTSRTFNWQLSDAEPTTALSVDVYESPRGWSPIFRTRGGQTSNPYEGATYTKYYQPGTQLDEATMRVENPELRVKGASTVTDVPTGGKAKFDLELINASETNTICTYILEAKEGSNPNGAILTIDGMFLSNGKSGRTVKMKGGEVIEKQLFVEQSDRSITDYENIQIVLKSVKDTATVSEPIVLSVHYVPASAQVEMKVDHTVLNQELFQQNHGVMVTLQNLDRQDEGLMGLRVRYRRKGLDSWTLAQEWLVDPEDGQAQLPETPTITTAVNFPEDGIYELQAQTFGHYGTEEVTYETDPIEITQDTHGPKILGMVSPESGLLTYMNRNNMHLRFNEVLNGNALSKSDNFRIEGGLNNVVYGASQYPDVAVQLTNERIETEAMYDLTNTDYAFDMWFYRQGDGTIISLGTDDNLLSLSTHDGGKLRARVGSKTDVFDTPAVLPENKWTYFALNYKHGSPVSGGSADEGKNTITMLYATADDIAPVFVGKDLPAKELDGHGKLSIGGDGMQGRIAELSIWNSDVTAQQLYETRTMSRASYTQGLVGYWDMTEGHGTQITDRARSRHFQMPSESWYINNENRAAHLSGQEGSPLKIDISTFNPAKTDNFAYEMWFRGNEADNQGQATLMSVQNSSTTGKEVADSVYVDTSTDSAGSESGYWNYKYKTTTTDIRTSIGFDNGRLALKLTQDATITIRTDGLEVVQQASTVRSDITLSDQNYLDGNWHHLALNVRRGTSAIVYLDGEAVKVLAETAVPGISSHYLTVGGEQQGDQETNRFTGDVDELRIWNGALDGSLIADRMYDRLGSSYPGLVGYFPMEDIHRTVQGTITTDFSLQNFGEPDSRLAIEGATVPDGSPSGFSQAPTAPALRPGSTRLRLDDSQFGFTASADEIYFSFPDAVLPQMDGNDFVATVSYIKDEHGNNSEPVQWKFRADFACVKWHELDLFYNDVTKKWDETQTVICTVTNPTGAPQTYEISGLPQWMTVDSPVGTVSGDYTFVTFTLSDEVPVGRYTEYIYLTDRLGIRRVMQMNIQVTGDEPQWSVNPNLYESNMMLTGQVYVGDKISEYTDTKIAAFDAMNNCRGVASPEYVSTRDAYYVNMIIYGGSATELSTGETDLTFKLYDASTGKTYPIVNVTVPSATTDPDGSPSGSTTLRYAPDAIIGSYDAPVIFSSTDLLQQDIALPTGWSWMSIYVQPESTAISDVLPSGKANRKKFMNIKSHDAMASVDEQDATVKGSLKQIVPGQMYKVQLSSPVSYSLIGSLILVRETAATVYPGWNWIGSLSGDVMSVRDAFADLAPVNGDIVKNRTAFASYRDGQWEGTLKTIIPGQGYIYRSLDTETKTYHYPQMASAANVQRSTLNVQRSTFNVQRSTYAPVDPHLFPDNMNVIAVVKRGDEAIEDAEVAAFVDGECRGATTFDDGYYFLTIMGSSADDQGKDVTIRVYADGEEYDVARVPFVSDAIYGTLAEPHVLDLSTVDGIVTVSGDSPSDLDDTDWYTLQGFKIGRRPIRSGVYIHRGRKVTIK